VPDDDGGQQWQCAQQHSDAGDVGEPQKQAPEHQRQAGRCEGTAAGGQGFSARADYVIAAAVYVNRRIGGGASDYDLSSESGDHRFAWNGHENDPESEDT